MDSVIVTYNSATHLRGWLETPQAFDRVIVVDNGSSDDSLEVAAAAGFEVIRMPSNRGFAAAANVGARHTSGPFFCVLNPDVYVDAPDGLRGLTSHFADPEVGAVAPALRLPGGVRQDSARRVPSIRDLIVRRVTPSQPDAVWSSIPLDVEWVAGAFIMLRREAFDAVGGFDERFFLYFEDVDLSLRLRAEGYRVRYDPTRQLRHDHQAASRDSLSTPAARQHMRSAARFYCANPRYAIRTGSRR